MILTIVVKVVTEGLGHGRDGGRDGRRGGRVPRRRDACRHVRRAVVLRPAATDHPIGGDRGRARLRAHLGIRLGWPTLAKLAPIIGAFVAGLAIGRSPEHARIERDLAPTANLLIPVFFVQIGSTPTSRRWPGRRVLGFAGALLVVAIIGKLVSAVGAIGVRSDKLLIGLGMIPRGEVGIIFASIGLAEGVLGDDQYAALLIVVLATTLLTPPLLRWRVGQRRGRRGSDRRPRRVGGRHGR